VSEIDQDEQLRNVTKWKKPKDHSPARLGSLVEGYMNQEVAPKYKQFSSVEQAWRQAVPEELASHCRCDSVSGGQLKIVVDSPAYMYKLQAMSSDLVEKLGHFCRRPRIRSIKFIPGLPERLKSSES
jgi:predicted nucleic acid-binding Zn ribbon protein